MQRAEIEDKLKEIIRPYVNDKLAFEQITEHTDLLKDLKINSAHLIDLVLDTEAEFNITIEDEAVEQMQTVKDALDVIEARLA